MEGLPLNLQMNILLRAKQHASALELLTGVPSFNHVMDQGMELITEICNHGLNETEDLIEILTCGDMLIYIARHFNPKLALISLLEQAEAFNFSSKFTIFIQPLQIVLSKAAGRRASNTAWVLKTLNSHLRTFNGIPQIVQKYKDEEDCSKIENEPQIQQALYFYNELVSLYDVLSRPADESGPSTSSAPSEVGESLHNVLRDNLVELLGPPLVYLDLSWMVDENTAEESKTSKDNKKSESRLIAEKIMNLLARVNEDPNHFINWVESKQLKNLAKMFPEGAEALPLDEDVADVDDNHTDAEPKPISVSNLAYLLYGEKLEPSLLPSQLFTSSHIFCTNLFLVMEFLAAPLDHSIFLLKGLRLAKGMIENIKTTASLLSAETMLQPNQLDFLGKLGVIVVYCESRRVRITAIDVFTKYLWSFDPSGRHKVLLHLFNTVEDPGLFGHCITQLKEFLRVGLDEKQAVAAGVAAARTNSMQEHFLGPNLLSILTPLCGLDNGAQTDLVHYANKIIPMLNLLRYTFIRDGAENSTGVKAIFGHIESNLLKPLRIALDITKVHCQRRLKDLTESDSCAPTNNVPGSDGMEFAIIDGLTGQELQGLPEKTKQNQTDWLHSALGTLDLLESLLARVNETLMTAAMHTQKISV